MSDLISRQVAIDAIHNLYAIHWSEGSWIDQKDAFKALNSLPSAQPELIRCKDCKHWRSNGDFPRGQYCTRFQGSGYIWHSRPEDFCSLAEPTLSQQETGLSEENQRRMIK